MIREKMYKKIQKYKRKGYSKTEIITVLGKDPKTVAKYYALDEKGFRSYRREHMFRDKALEDYEKDILEVYETNEFAKLNMSSVYDYLEERRGELPGCGTTSVILSRRTS